MCTRRDVDRNDVTGGTAAIFHAGTAPRQRYQRLIRRPMESVGQCAGVRIRRSWSTGCPALAPESGVVLPVHEKVVRDLCSLAAVAAVAPRPRPSAFQAWRPACSGDQVRAWSDAVGCQWQGLAADVAVTVAVSWPYADLSHRATAAFCLVGTPEWVARQDHPARD
jgi:hypothetical protein